MKDFKWIIRSHQIKDSPVTVQDVEVAISTWGKSILALKGKTTQTKYVPVSRDYVKVPKEMLKLHHEVFLTADIFFVNKILFFLTLITEMFVVQRLSTILRAEPFHTYKRHSRIYSCIIFNEASKSLCCKLMVNSRH